MASTISPLEKQCCITNNSGGKTLANRFSSCISPKIPRCLELPSIFSKVFIWLAKLNTCSLVPLISDKALVTSVMAFLDSANCWVMDWLDERW